MPISDEIKKQALANAKQKNPDLFEKKTIVEIIENQKTEKQVKKLQTEITALRKNKIEAETNRNVAYVISFLLLIFFTLIAFKEIKVFSRVRYLKNSPEVSDEFKNKRKMLADLLKSEAINQKEYKQKMKVLIHETSMRVKQAKLNEALNSKVISVDEFNSKSGIK